VRVASREVGRCELERCKLIAMVYKLWIARYEARAARCDCVGCIFFGWMWGFVAAAAAANHPRGASAIRLGAEEVGAVTAGVISGSPCRIFFAKIRKVIAAAAAANHPRDAEVVGDVAAGVISGSPAAFFFTKLRRVIAAAVAANQSRGVGATGLSAEVVGEVAAGVISSSPATFFL
jgi:hypothetical protein